MNYLAFAMLRWFITNWENWFFPPPPPPCALNDPTRVVRVHAVPIHSKLLCTYIRAMMDPSKSWLTIQLTPHKKKSIKKSTGRAFKTILKWNCYVNPFSFFFYPWSRSARFEIWKALVPLRNKHATMHSSPSEGSHPTLPPKSCLSW